MPAPPPTQFVALNALRGIAALIVVQRHGYFFLGGAMLPGGYMAVDFFFLLSGFVLAHAYDERLRSSMSTARFMGARLLRLYPLYLLGLVLTLPAAIDSSPAAFAAGLLFLPDFWVANFIWVIPASWSLLAELAANLGFGRFHRLLSRPVLIGAVLVALAGLVALAIVHGSVDAGSMGSNWAGGFLRVAFTFPLGVLLYRSRSILARWAPSWATWPAAILLVAALGIPVPPALLPLRDLVVVAVLMPAILLFASNARPKPLSAGIAQAMGDMSYAIYVLHAALFAGFSALLLHLTGHPLESASGSEIAVVLFAMVIGALLADQYYDKPVRRWLASLLRRPSVSPAAS